MTTGLHIASTWNKLTVVWKWVVTTAGSVTALIVTYFTVVGFINAMDTLVLSEVEAAQNQVAQIKIWDQYGAALDNERRQREIGDTILELQRIDFQVSYLTRLTDQTIDNVLQLEVLREIRVVLRARLRKLRCVDSGTPLEEC